MSETALALAYAQADARQFWYESIAPLLGIRSSRNCTVNLWRRIPHPDTRGQNGPEIDVAIQTEDSIFFIEAKWRGSEAKWQGANCRSTQIDLRLLFAETFAPRMYRGKRSLIVYVMLDDSQRITPRESSADTIAIRWKELRRRIVHPLGEEIRGYYDWKRHLIARRFGAPAAG